MSMVPNQHPQPETEEINPLDGAELGRTRKLADRVRQALGQLPADRVGEVTSLVATVEGHLAADPPNAVAAREALEMIRDEFTAGGSPGAVVLVADLDRVIHMLGAID